MKPDLPLPLDSVRWPVLAELAEVLTASRRRALSVEVVRALGWAFSCQLVVLPVLALISSRQPHQFIWIAAMGFSPLFFLWPGIVFVLSLRSPRFRLDIVADEMDKRNPGQPDPFRTLLSLGNHHPETLDELNRYYTRLKSSLAIPVRNWFEQRHRVFFGICLFTGILLPAFSGHYQETVLRAAMPFAVWKNRPIPQIEIVGLPERVSLGDTLRADLHLKKLPEGQPVFAHVLGAEERRYVLDRTGDRATFRMGPITADLRLRFSAPGVETGEFRIRAVPPPGLQSLSATVQPPAYTRLPAEKVDEVPPSLNALPGSVVSWVARPSQSLSSLQVVFETMGKAQPETLVLGEGREFAFHRSVHGSLEYRFLLLDADGLKGTVGPFHVEPGIDAAPEITLMVPAGDQVLSRALKVPVAFQVRDDFGISSVQLRYSIFGDAGLKSEGSRNLKDWLQAGAGGMGGGIWDLDGMDLFPGNWVELFLEAKDNDAVSGPKSSHSVTVRLRMPSLEEVMAEVEAEEKAAATSLRSAVERAERSDREAEKGAAPQRTESMPPPAGWELQRILNAAPRQHLQRLRRHLESESGKAGRETTLGRQVEGLRREAAEMEKRLPSAETEHAPLEEQAKRLETLMRDQQTLDQRLSEMKPLPSPTEPLAQERKSLQEELKRNRNEQGDLQEWLRDQMRQKEDLNRLKEQTAKADERVREDMQKALEQMQKAMEKGLENGTLSPDLLEKMERIRELLREVMPDSLRQRLEREANRQQPDAEEVRKNLQDLLEKRQGLREGLDRAIRMLEMMREMRNLKNLAQVFRNLESQEMELGQKMEAGSPGGEMQESQAALRRRLEESRKELERMASEQKEFRALKNEPNAREAEAEMRAAEESLRGKPKAGGDAAQKAKGAGRSLGKSAEALEGALAGMEGGPDPSEIIAVLEETLDFTRWLDSLREGEAAQAGWDGGEDMNGQRASQIARWLRGRLAQLAAAQPYEGGPLAREASALAYHAEAMGEPGRLDSLRLHARKAARELLKALAKAQSESSGEGQGEGDQAGGKGKGKGKGQGQGQGEGGESDGMAGRIRGMSGRQMAVNQATQQLLQSFLQGRSPGQGGASEGGGKEGGGKEGESQGSSGQSAVNGQQGVGEALESLAEGADDAGGAARKLRQLAEEARALEKELRRGRVDADAIRRKQDRFQTKLLEAAMALEERGRDQKRQAEAFRGQSPLTPGPIPVDPNRQDQLKRKRAEARALRLPPEQKRRVEWYYEDLLTR